MSLKHFRRLSPTTLPTILTKLKVNNGEFLRSEFIGLGPLKHWLFDHNVLQIWKLRHGWSRLSYCPQEGCLHFKIHPFCQYIPWFGQNFPVVWSFWATVCKTVRPMLSDPCLSCLSCLSVQSVTLVYCGQTVEWIKMKLGMRVGIDPGHIVLDGDPAPPPPKGQGRGLPGSACQVSSWSVQPIGHSARTSQTDRPTDRQTDRRTDNGLIA